MSTQIENYENGQRHSGARPHEAKGESRLKFVKVSGIGRDRLGIVYKIAKVIRGNGGNVFLQRSMRVAGEFAFTIIASFDHEDLNGKENVLKAFGPGVLGEDFIVFAREIELNKFAPQHENGSKYVVSVAGNDQMGIVESMTLLLLQNSINLDSMESEVSYRPFSGEPTFSSMFEITVPDDFEMSVFLIELEQFEKTTDLTIVVRQQ